MKLAQVVALRSSNYIIVSNLGKSLMILSELFLARDSIITYAYRVVCYRPSVRLSVRHTGVSYKNG